MSARPVDPRGSAPPAPGAPRWARALLGRLAEPGRADEVVGDLEEVHRERAGRRGRVVASVLTGLEAVDMAAALLRERRHRRSIPTASWLDFKLGLRMLARYPSLTAVAVMAMAFGIATGAGALEFMKDQVILPLPYADGERIVRIQNVSTETTRPELRALHDFEAWREQLRSVERLSALRLRDRDLAIGEAAAAPVAEAAVSAAAFGLLRRPPLLGRPLLAADEAPGAPAVAVIGHELWRERFGGDPHVVGRVVRLGGELTTVVGVMPPHVAFFVPREGFTLPAPQDLWVPFRLRALDHARGDGPALTIFGRMAPGATPASVQAELATLAASAAVEWPDTHAHLRPAVLGFARPFASSQGLAASGMLTLSALFLAALMVVVCGNVALLLFARAATREGEIAVRSALGASRGRIVAQLFAEALVLAAVAIVVGLAGASAGLRWVVRMLESLVQAQGLSMPSWIDHSLSPTTIGYAVALAVVGAVVAGVLPGLKVTGARAQANLQRLAGRGAGVRLGGVWTGIIVTQVALTVMLVPIAAVLGLQTWKVRTMDHALPAAEYLAVRLEMDGNARAGASPGAEAPVPPGARADDGFHARFEASYRALERRLAAEPGVTGVTIAGQLPGNPHPRRLVEVDGPGGVAAVGGSTTGSLAQVASVDPGFFDVLRAPILAGRGFGTADVGAAQRVAVVNESFVHEFLGGRNAVGQRVRYRDPSGRDEPGPWHVIVGVVQDLAMTVDPTLAHHAGIYHPLLPGEAYPLRLAVRVTGEPAAFAGRIHELAAEAAPALRIHRPVRIDQAAQGLLIAHDAWFRVIVLAGAMALLLTNAGIYAVLSFTVARRTREIGVRVALGADRRQVVAAILARTARHVAVGVLIGGALGSLATVALSEGSFRPTALQGGGLLVTYMAVMLGVCLMACVVPLRRALRIEPSEALAAEG